jgi:hypothetical protein
MSHIQPISLKGWLMYEFDLDLLFSILAFRLELVYQKHEGKIQEG